MSFRIEETLLSQSDDSVLTTTQSAGIITECLLSEVPLSNRVTKAAAILASCHWTLCLPAVSVSPANASMDHRNPGDRRAQFFYHSADNRGPPLA